MDNLVSLVECGGVHFTYHTTICSALNFLATCHLYEVRTKVSHAMAEAVLWLSTSYVSWPSTNCRKKLSILRDDGKLDASTSFNKYSVLLSTEFSIVQSPNSLPSVHSVGQNGQCIHPCINSGSPFPVLTALSRFFASCHDDQKELLKKVSGVGPFIR
ncbi:unnamed protein product [Soboliphyme baturini]|uniref:Pentatricopeptide repeat-containing protein n=1 Tax=Soboliphyme baturini TaxID=241478 RepID=A0A183IY81_9BILA|nr:unnamed protein product [Soboliphyme baturini]